MDRKEEEETKKTFYYQHNKRANACQNLKEGVMKVYGKPFLIVCDFIKGLITAITQQQEYNHILKRLPLSNKDISNVTGPLNPEKISIQRSAPFTYKEMEEIYNMSKYYNIPIDILINYAISSGLSVLQIKREME